ncbi:hypothetical protein Tco_0914444 [Tanacetum coccineum]
MTQLTFEVCHKRGAFIEELEKLRCSANAMQSATFLHDTERRDVEKVTRLLLMIKQLQLQTSKKVSFLWKLRDMVLVSPLTISLTASSSFANSNDGGVPESMEELTYGNKYETHVNTPKPVYEYLITTMP